MRSHKKSVHKKSRRRFTSTTSGGSGPSNGSDSDSEEDDGNPEEEEEDLPDVPFTRIMALNKPELMYIISKFAIKLAMLRFLTLNYHVKLIKLITMTS